MNFVLTGCRVIDVENGCTVLPGRDIYVAGGRIEEVAPHGAARPGYRRVGAEGLYALPGLINLHVHLFGSGKPSKALGGGRAQERLLKFIRTRLGGFVLSKIVLKSARQQLLSGVTTIRAVGDLYGSDLALKRRTAAGKGGAAGLRMLVSGMAITVPGGHGAGTFARTAETQEGLCRLVDEAVGSGADLVKICVTGGVMDAGKRGEPGEVKMTLEQVRAVCDRAHALGKKVAAHVQSAEGVRIAALGGVDTVEHGAPFTEEALAALRERGGALVVTYSPAVPCARLPHGATRLNETSSYNSEVVMRGMTEGARQAAEAGVAVGLGTDASCPFCMQAGTWRELVYFQKVLGVPAAEALRAATIGNARILGLERETGSVAAGKSADLLLVAADPLEDLRALRAPRYVSAQGRLLRRPRPKRDTEIERLLDRLTEEL